MEFVQQYFIYLLIAAVFVLYGIFAIMYAVKRKKEKQQKLNDDPTLVKVFVASGQQGIKTVQIKPRKLDGEYLGELYVEGIKTLFLAKAGKHVLEVEATTSRPGIMDKRVNETFGPLNIEIDLEMGKTYTLAFDVKTKMFQIKEN